MLTERITENIRKRTFSLIAMIALLVFPFSFALLKRENGVELSFATITIAKALGVYSVIVLALLTTIAAIETRWRRIAQVILGVLWAIILCTVAILRFLLQIFSVEINAYHFQMLKETNRNETAGFIQTYILSWDMLGIARDFAVSLLCAGFIYFALRVIGRKTHLYPPQAAKAGLTVWIMACLMCFSFNIHSFGRKYLLEDIGELSRYPAHQLLRAYYQGQELNKEVDDCIANLQNVQIDSCSYESPYIILIIGESHNRHHSSLYGYPLETNPRLQKRSNLFVFNDVIAPTNATAVVFRHLMSSGDISSDHKWCDVPLFPAVFRQAGYNVVFYSNQFCRGGWDADAAFLNHAAIDKQCFDIRNTERYQYDNELIEAYKKCQKAVERPHNLIIFHLQGQHVKAKDRFPAEFAKFTAKDYSQRTDLTLDQRQQIADYDNATLYNDMIVDKIISLYEDKDAIVIYTSDHGDEVNDFRPHVGRSCDYDECGMPLIKTQLDIPFIIWCSPSYKEAHPATVLQIAHTTKRPFMTDNIAHILFGLAGIHTPIYNPTKNLIDPLYKPTLPRLFIDLGTYNSYREYKS